MARGITETDVHTAADALVAAGERPTVDRIRAHLGTGSPNTVTRWLETWWQALASRLQAHTVQLALPQAPAPVARLAQQLWEQALAAAEEAAAAQLLAERCELDDQRARLRSEKEARDATLAQAEGARKHAEAAHAQALSELGHAHALIQRQDAQIADLIAHRDTTEGARARLAEQLSEAVALQQRDAAAALTERAALRSHMLAVEDRAQREIDRARLEAKQARLEVAATIKQYQAEIQTARQSAEQARARVTTQDLELTELKAQLQRRPARRTSTDPKPPRQRMTPKPSATRTQAGRHRT
ncbi:DNA-binding protein [Pseudoxanthomonas mexicana]